MKKKGKLFVTATGFIALALPAVVSVAATQPESYYVASGSMEPTLLLGSHIPVQKNAYQDISQVKRGDIIVYSRLDKATGKPDEPVKRVVGLPGDQVQLTGTSIFINGRKLSHVLLRRVGKVSVYQETNGKATYRIQHGGSVAPAHAFSTRVPAAQLFCLGDNRDNANDSRYTGSVPFTSVKGKRVP